MSRPAAFLHGGFWTITQWFHDRIVFSDAVLSEPVHLVSKVGFTLHKVVRLRWRMVRRGEKCSMKVFSRSSNCLFILLPVKCPIRATPLLQNVLPIWLLFPCRHCKPTRCFCVFLLRCFSEEQLPSPGWDREAAAAFTRRGRIQVRRGVAEKRWRRPPAVRWGVFSTRVDIHHVTVHLWFLHVSLKDPANARPWLQWVCADFSDLIEKNFYLKQRKRKLRPATTATLFMHI